MKDPEIIPVTPDPNPAPAFLKREKRPISLLPMTEDMKTEPVLSSRADNIPHSAPPNPDGMNMIELYLTEGGRRRYLAVSVGTVNMQLLHLPDLEHVEADVRISNEQVAMGKAHWFSLPPNLGDRLIDKAVAWEMYGFKYSRSLVNEALVKLGRPALDPPKEITQALASGLITQKKSGGRGASSTNRGPGVIDTIISLLQSGGGTVEEMALKLHDAFPDRELVGMTATIRTQLNRLPKQGRLTIIKEGSTYRADGAAAKPVVSEAIKKEIDVALPAAAPTSDFIEQVAKQKAREKEYLANPVVGEIKRKPPQTVARKVIGKVKSKAKAKKKG